MILLLNLLHIISTSQSMGFERFDIMEMLWFGYGYINFFFEIKRIDDINYGGNISISLL